MNEQLQKQIQDCPGLPSLPTVAIEVLRLARSLDTDMKGLAAVIERDPALSVRVLKTVNSSYYGRSQKVTTISQALVVMGLQSVRSLVLGFSLAEGLLKHNTAGFDHVVYWRRSFYAACAAKEIGIAARVMQAEELFVCGLLADIGMLVMDVCLGGTYGDVCRVVVSHNEQHVIEQDRLETDHAEVGGFIADMWKLPPVLCEPIRWHIHPAKADDATLQTMAEIVAIAGRCADVFVDINPASAIAEVRKRLSKLLEGKIPNSAEFADTLLAKLGGKVKEMTANFEFDAGPEIRYDKILRNANEALVELTLQSQQQAVNMQQKAADMQVRFAVREAELKKRATTDGLTGLANRAEFDRFLAEELAQASGEGRCLALIMVDIDKFKVVNDTYGHPTGDIVIQYVGNLMSKHAEEGDLAARYGGEEMALVLNSTDRSTAAAVAEDIRRALAAKLVEAGNAKLPITASFGVAAYEPPSPLNRSDLLVKAADRALYHAKETGRNRVKVFSLPQKGVA